MSDDVKQLEEQKRIFEKAVITTCEKYGNEHAITAILNFITDNNADGFTRDNNTRRELIDNITPEDMLSILSNTYISNNINPNNVDKIRQSQIRDQRTMLRKAVAETYAKYNSERASLAITEFITGDDAYFTRQGGARQLIKDNCTPENIIDLLSEDYLQKLMEREQNVNMTNVSNSDINKEISNKKIPNVQLTMQEYMEISDKYSNVKLGILDRIKVWNEKRAADSFVRAYKDVEGDDGLGVDYTKADALEIKLLEQRRLKIATKDARREYKAYLKQGGNDGLGEADYIEKYLMENGLKQKTLPAPEPSKNHEFMSKYPVEKTPEEVAYEKANEQPEIYYKIGDIEYELPLGFENYIQKTQASTHPIYLDEKGKGKYVINEKIRPEDKYEMLKNMTKSSMNYLSALLGMYKFKELDASIRERWQDLFGSSRYANYKANKLTLTGNIAEANGILDKKMEDILKFYQDFTKDEQQAEIE